MPLRRGFRKPLAVSTHRSIRDTPANEDTLLRTVLLLLALSSLAPAANAGAGEAGVGHPAPAERRVANLGKGCRMAARLLPSQYGGLGGDPGTGWGGIGVNPLPKDWHSHLDSLGFSLTCLDAGQVADGIGAVRLDASTGTWKKDLGKRIRALGYPLSPQEYREAHKAFDHAIRVYNVSAVNAQGYVDSEDDTTGDAAKRVRRLGFCLIHGPKALCGEGVVALLRYAPQDDLTPKALDIIRSIEFLPDED